MEIKFVEGYKVMYDKMDIGIMFPALEQEASENISNCLARLKHKEDFTEVNLNKYRGIRSVK